MTIALKLNLGCGQFYKQGYLNIDKFNDSVADKICDTASLPFKSNSVDLIEAEQLIEHFDFIHCKYVLSEWFRVLKPTGELIIETPDLEKSFRKFLSSDLKAQRITLQWIYGIDSPGMQHKTGFTLELLEDLLEETGFEKISREKAKTHLYEPGLRVSCRKPQEYSEKQLFALFRKRLKKGLGTDDSLVLIPLEKWIEKINKIYNARKKDPVTCENEIIAATAACNPIIPKTFLEESIRGGFVKESAIARQIKFLKWLCRIEFHKKVFTLWMKGKKNENDLQKEFLEFLNRIQGTLLDIISKNLKYEERLEYISKLEPAETTLFDFNLTLFKTNHLESFK